MMEWSTRNYAVWAVVALAAATVVSVLTFAASFAPAVSAKSSDHGASFAVKCNFSHRASDDPIVHPGHQGMAHSHDFFGNTSTNHSSTYESLLAEGVGTTCTRFEEDKAAYWLPTVSWDGVELDSNRAVFYYRAGGKDHKRVGTVPARLKIIAGNEKRVTWRCGDTDNGGGSQNPPSRCASGELGVRIIFPDCIDVLRNGAPRLDSADHRSHMAYSRPIKGKVRCPRAFPRSVPVLTMNVTFKLPKPEGKVTLSSGPAPSMHADFFNAWDQAALNGLVARCINRVPPSKPRPEDCQSPRLSEPGA